VWKQFQPDSIAGIDWLQVRGIGPRVKLLICAVGFDLAAINGKERPDDAVFPNEIHCRKAIRSGSPEDPHQNGFCAVIAVLGDGDLHRNFLSTGTFNLVPDFKKRAIAKFSAGFFRRHIFF